MTRGLLPVVLLWAADRTEIMVAYDDEYLYASGRCFDSRPADPDQLARRRRWSGDDTFAPSWACDITSAREATSAHPHLHP